jgi:hypothetical protein
LLGTRRVSRLPMDSLGVPYGQIIPFPTGYAFSDVAQGPRTHPLSPPLPLPFPNRNPTQFYLPIRCHLAESFMRVGRKICWGQERFSGCHWKAWGSQMVRSAPSTQGMPFLTQPKAPGPQPLDRTSPYPSPTVTPPHFTSQFLAIWQSPL